MTKIPVFDIGDTLNPSRPFSKKVFREELKRQGIEDPPEYPFFGYNSHDTKSIRSWLEQEGIEADPEKMVERCEQEKIKMMKRLGRFEMLRRIEAEIAVPGIISDNEIIAEKFYKNLFKKHNVKVEGFVVSEEEGDRKPNPAIFREFLKERGVDGEECVYFGNRGDIDSGCRKVGMDFVWVKEFDTFDTSWDGKSVEKLTFENVARFCR